MSDQIQINAQIRELAGKGASRRLRRENKVPGIIYGGDAAAQSLTLDANELSKALQVEAFFSQVLQVNVEGGASEQALVRDMQRHPATERVAHIDFLRVSADRAVEVQVPLHFMNEESCVGVKIGGGSLSHNMSEVAVSCLPKDLPEFLEVDVAELDVGDSIHLSGIKLPEGVVIPELQHGSDHDLLVVSVNAPRGSSDDVEEDAPAAEASSDEPAADDDSADE